MPTFLSSDTTWFLVSAAPECGLPPRIAITPPFRIGRREGFDLCLSCRNVSGLHAELLEEDGQLFVEDLNSTNGTFLNGTKIQEKTALKEGDRIQFGQSVFTISSPVNEKVPDRTLAIDNISRELETPQETTEDRFNRLLVHGVVPYFQPVFDISGESNKRIGFEVLGRSRLFGLKTPHQMFTVATDLEKESELSRVLRMRGIEAAENTLAPEIKIFVNTHPAELDPQEIQSSLERIRTKYPSREIMLELPELVLYAPDEYQKVFEVVRELNVRLVLHDFGAGQIRLTELSKMSPAVVKFDCALIQGIDEANPSRQKLVSAMIKMTKELGITPMAEYVETEGEHATLKQLGFVLAQGFHYGRPTSVEDIEAMEVASSQDEADSIESGVTVAKVNRTPARPLASLNSIDEDEPSTVEVEKSELPSGAADSILAEADDSAIGDHKDAKWLLEQDPNSHTLQLMFTAKSADASQFVDQQTQPGEYAIYKKWSSNRFWYVVVYGVYADRASAKTDTELFEESGHSTWVRNLEKVHEEVRSIENANAI